MRRYIEQINIAIAVGIDNDAAGIFIKRWRAASVAAWPGKTGRKTGPIGNGNPAIAIGVTAIALVR